MNVHAILDSSRVTFYDDVKNYPRQPFPKKAIKQSRTHQTKSRQKSTQITTSTRYSKTNLTQNSATDDTLGSRPLSNETVSIQSLHLKTGRKTNPEC